MSTRRWPAEQAFRMRVSISATGSVRLIPYVPLPAGLAHARDFPLQGELTKTDTAEAELPQHGAAPAAALTAADAAHLELRRALGPLDPGRLCHLRNPLRCLAAERPTELAQQRHRQIVPGGRGHDRDVHPVDLLDLVEVDLGKDHLLLDAERVVAPTVEAPVRQPAEVADPGDRQRDEAIQELVHPGLAERDGAADRHNRPEPEVGDRLLGAGDDRALT